MSEGATARTNVRMISGGGDARREEILEICGRRWWEESHSALRRRAVVWGMGLRLGRTRTAVLFACLAIVLAVVATITARTGFSQRRMFIEPNAAYDGRFTFVRLSYTVYGRSGWEFDYPAMERNFMTILKDLTTVHPHVAREQHPRDGRPGARSSIPSRICRSRATGTRREQATGLRTWLAKGGFLIVDDFYCPASGTTSSGRCTGAAQRQHRSARRVASDLRLVLPDQDARGDDDIPTTSSAKAEYNGIYENNDPTRRLMVIINYNNDIGDYMEWSGQGWYPINISNDAYKLATNYIVYAMTH